VKNTENNFKLSFLNIRYTIFTRENIASGVHSVKYISILHAKPTNILYVSDKTIKKIL
jgi:hypothetical protein